jgi:hypothetical protein
VAPIRYQAPLITNSFRSSYNMLDQTKLFFELRKIIIFIILFLAAVFFVMHTVGGAETRHSFARERIGRMRSEREMENK